ncbi:MAG TPA: thioesterase family protein [Anaeromyxobacter sp.]|nr:thioesterase family protein [Anaeromyxobacter sp.]
MATRYPVPPDDAVVIELQIPFHDVDVLEVAWHGHYPKYLELARTAFFRSRRIDAPDMRALGFRFYVSEYFLRHLAPLRYGDQVRVHAWPVEVRNRIRIAYRIENVTLGKLAAQGWTVLVSTDADGGLCFETPGPILERLRAPGAGSAADVEVEEVAS